MPTVTHIRASTDYSDIGQTSTIGQVKDLMNTLVSGGTSYVADCEYLIALEEIAFSDDPSS
jgi:hypothetical protein